MVDGINRDGAGRLRAAVPGRGRDHRPRDRRRPRARGVHDLRVASSAGKYGLTEVRVGVPYPQGAIGVVQAELPAPACGCWRSATSCTTPRTCLELGVFDEVVEPDAVLPRALEIARDLATLPADVYARTKRDLRGATIERLRAAAADDPLLARWV